MKKRLIVWIILMLAVGSCCFSNMGDATAEQAGTALRDMMNLYEEVLQGKRSYTQCNTLDNTQTDALFQTKTEQWYGYEFTTPIRFETFCVTDLDADGNPETLLSLAEDFGFELLRCENGVVYGFPFTYRAMEQITREGDLYGCDGAQDNQWYHVKFHANQVETAEVCAMRSTDDGQGVQFFIGDQQVTEAEYNQYSQKIEQKERPVWLPFNQANIEAVVSQF